MCIDETFLTADRADVGRVIEEPSSVWLIFHVGVELEDGDGSLKPKTSRHCTLVWLENNVGAVLFVCDMCNGGRGEGSIGVTNEPYVGKDVSRKDNPATQRRQLRKRIAYGLFPGDPILFLIRRGRIPG